MSHDSGNALNIIMSPQTRDDGTGDAQRST